MSLQSEHNAVEQVDSTVPFNNVFGRPDEPEICSDALLARRSAQTLEETIKVLKDDKKKLLDVSAPSYASVNISYLLNDLFRKYPRWLAPYLL